jgi:hypothetical protein
LLFLGDFIFWSFFREFHKSRLIREYTPGGFTCTLSLIEVLSCHTDQRTLSVTLYQIPVCIDNWIEKMASTSLAEFEAACQSLAQGDLLLTRKI